MESAETIQQQIDEDVHVDEDAQTQTQTNKDEGVQTSKKRKTTGGRSIHWAAFEEVMIDNIRKGKCRRCGIFIAADPTTHGTNGLRNHNRSCSKKYEARSDQTVLNVTPSDDGTSCSLRSWKFDQMTSRHALCRMIIIDELPFTFVEREGFRMYNDTVCPLFKIPSRQTVRKDCMKMFLEQKDRLNIFFKIKGMGRVSITTDRWTSVNNVNFICVTAHCIGADWVLHKKIIGFCKILSHKGNDIGESVIASLRQWELENVLCCTLDNAIANEGAVRYINKNLDTWKTNVLSGKYLHLRCVAHILNLVVSDSLEEIGMSVRRVREAVKWVKASPARTEQFKEYVQVTRVEYTKSLCMDVPTRWNSTYLMLESAQPYTAAFRLFRQMSPAYLNDLNQKKYKDLRIGPPEEDDWVNVRKIIEYLKKFYELTLLVSGTTYATSHLFFVEMCDVFDLITELEQNDDFDVRVMATKMRLKVGKYWLEEIELNPKMNRILYIAALLDPRQKMKYLEKCFHSIYGADRAKELVEEVMDAMNDLFEFYKNEVAPTPTKKSDAYVAVRSRGRVDRRGVLLSQLGVQESDEETNDTDTSELNLYFTERQYKVAKNEADRFDILSWWRVNGTRYPILSVMARDILAIPISSVASECAFSVGGRVLSPYRSSLTPHMVDALVCAQDWLKSSSNDNIDEGVPEEELDKEFEEVCVTLGLREMATSSATHTAESQSHVP